MLRIELINRTMTLVIMALILKVLVQSENTFATKVALRSTDKEILGTIEKVVLGQSQ